MVKAKLKKFAKKKISNNGVYDYMSCFCCHEDRDVFDFLKGYLIRQVALDIAHLFLLPFGAPLWVLGLITSLVAINYVRHLENRRRQPGSSSSIMAAFYSNMIGNMIGSFVWLGISVVLMGSVFSYLGMSEEKNDRGQNGAIGILFFYIGFCLFIVWGGFLNQFRMLRDVIRANKEINCYE